MTPRASYSIADLAAAGGVSRRTVRFYVQRALLPPPEGLGRGARYSDRHLARLLQIKGWQERGVPLEEVRGLLFEEAEGSTRARRDRGEAAPRGAPPRREPRDEELHDTPGTAWFRQPLVAGYELHAAGDRRPLTAQQLAKLARALGDILDNGGEDE